MGAAGFGKGLLEGGRVHKLESVKVVIKQTNKQIRLQLIHYRQIIRPLKVNMDIIPPPKIPIKSTRQIPRCLKMIDPLPLTPLLLLLQLLQYTFPRLYRFLIFRTGAVFVQRAALA